MIYVLISLTFILLLLYFISLLINNSKIKKLFETHNVAIFGAKGKGKDLLTQLIINLRKKPYFSNINYGGKCNLINIEDLSVDPNTYNDFINGKIEKIEKNILFEGSDVYLSDIGIFLPSQFDFQLSQKYKSLPIYYALSRHLYNQNIHFNTQALNRTWIKLREQADYYIKCLGIKKLLFGIIINIRTYNVYESALNNYQPTKARLFNKYSKAEKDTFEGEKGEIKEYKLYILKNHIYYDTRYFHKILFGYNKPDKRLTKKIERIINQ